MRLVLPALLLAIALSSCGEGEPSSDTSEAPFNDADVAFTTAMVQHHAQALSMTDLTLGRDVSRGLADLGEEIRAEQSAEIEVMVDWLADWDQPVPETVRDHANAHGEGGGDDHDAPGMLSADDLSELDELSGAAFEERWLELMIEHHEGAVDMAQTQVEDGHARGPVRLAEDMIENQQAEIRTMEQMLES
jgi:uncharacterized protein (DUF305 family)